MLTRIVNFFTNLRIRWKMLAVVLPLVTIPIFVVGGVIGYISNKQAYLGITKTSKDDLQHMAGFTIDLLNSHYQQFQVYKQDKSQIFNKELATLSNMVYSLVEVEHDHYKSGRLDLASAKEAARKVLKKVNVGDTGYIYAMTSKGELQAHVAREGENVFNEQDENGRYFIREICARGVRSRPGEVLYITYPWRNEALGDKRLRNKVVAYRYFREWDWIIATGGYLEETADDDAFERRSFAELKEKIRSKHVGKTGYIFCMDSKGTFMIHPEAEGINFYDIKDAAGFAFVREMCTKKSGWIRYSWKNSGEKASRLKIVRYEYFEPWDWIVAVGSYEDDFYQEANDIKGHIVGSMVVLTLLVCLVASGFVVIASKVLTDPINRMIEVIRKVRKGRLDEQMKVESGDELGELAGAFNRMTAIIKQNREMEASLAQQGKMASLGILSSGVAHEINNPLGVILGYASYLEGKIGADDPSYRFIHEIKRESKRCKKIVQDLLSYARTPKPAMEETDINELIGHIVDFAANHTDMHHVTVIKKFTAGLPLVAADGDQLRQVAINLILNAGAAMEDGGELVVGTGSCDGHVCITFSDSGTGIPAEDLERIFEPFFTTKTRGTGLGLAITRQIVEQHQGKIIIDSTVGAGTTVTVQLPLERDEL